MNWKRISFIFFVLYFIAGLCIYRQYGIGWDEGPQRNIGLINWNYIFNNDKGLLTSIDRYHGPAMEIFQVAVEKGLHLTSQAEIIRTRHLVNFLVFYASSIAFFLSALILFGTEKWALTATLMLVLSPKIFGESFFNSKDTICLSLMIFWLFTLLKLTQKPGFTRLLFHSLATALTVDLRVLTVITVPFTFALLLNEYYHEPKDRKKLIWIMPAFAVLVSGFIILFWPALWSSPVLQFIDGIKQMKHYPWEGLVFYMGRYIFAGKLPWHYLPVWILISTPALFSVLWVTGSVTMLSALIRNPLLFVKTGLIQLVIWLLCVVPVIMVIASHAIVYDSWRHVFFIYPFYILGAVYGLKSILQFTGERVKQLISGVFAAYLAMLLVIIIYMHPVENTYFNFVALAGFYPIQHEFERDYWGVSYNQGLEYLLKAGIPKPVKIKAANSPGESNKSMFTENEQQQFAFTDNTADAGYYITNYRWDWSPPPGKVVYSIKKFGVPVMTVFKIDK